MADRKLLQRTIPFTGKLVKSDDPTKIGANYQDLINLRYNRTSVEGVKGHTKINSTAMTTHLKPRSMFHFRKEFPVESHVMLQAENTGETGSAIWQLTPSTTIPNTTTTLSKNHSSTDHTSDALHTDNASAGLGRFSNTPDGGMAYCNEVETMFYGGDKFRVASVLVIDPDTLTTKYDITEAVSNTVTDTDEARTINTTGAADSNTMLLLHMEGADGGTTFTDSSPTTAHTVTANGNVNTDNAQAKFGTTSGSFDGTGDYLSIPDDADFDFSGGTWTIDCWVLLTSITSGRCVYYQETDDNNYIIVYVGGTFGNYVKMDIVAGGTSIFGGPLISSNPVPLSTFTHIAVVENGDDYYLFIDGVLSRAYSTTSRPANYTGDVFIGQHDHAGLGAIADFSGWIDEFRISDTARWTGVYDPASEPYDPAGTIKGNVYVGSIMPLQGVYWQLGTVNTGASTATAFYWDGSAWIAVSSLTDNTAAGGITLAQDGSITFTDTKSVAKTRSMEGMVLYWYKFVFSDIDASAVTVEYMTVDIAFQPLKDIWDGEYRTVLNCLEWDSANQVYVDHTFGVFEDAYDSASSSFASLVNANGTNWDTDTSTGDYLLVGSADRLTGMNINLIPGQENTVIASMTIEYWNGTAWTSAGSVTDGTLANNITLAKSGIVTWTAPDYYSEFKRHDLSVRRKAPMGAERDMGFWVGGDEDRYWAENIKIDYGSPVDQTLGESVSRRPLEMKQMGYPIYFYRIQFSGKISPDATGAENNKVEIYYIGGIPAQREILGYKFPLHYQESLWLCGSMTQHKNQIIKSSPGTVNVFNGAGARDFRIGYEDEVIGAAPVKVAFQLNLIEALIVFKKDKTYLLTGSVASYRSLVLDHKKGCVAPLTIQECNVSSESGSDQVILFLGANGVHLTNGKQVIDIHGDIADLFDTTSNTYIDPDNIGTAKAVYDAKEAEYHLFFRSNSGSDLDKEYVYTMEHNRWFEIDRGTGARIQCGVSVLDTSGNTYTYGGIDTGHMVRLENGTSFAKTTGTNDIAHTVHTGDIALHEDDVGLKAGVRKLNLIGIAKETTSNEVTITHHGDGKTTGDALDNTVSMSNSGYRIFDVTRSIQAHPYLYHSFKMTVSTNDESKGFEPLHLNVLYHPVRQKTE